MAAVKDLRPAVEQRHVRAEAREGLRHLGADRPAADHRQPSRQRGEVPQRLVGEEADFGETGNRRALGTRAGGDDGALEAQAEIADRDRVLGDEARVTEIDIDAQALEASGAVVLRDLGAQFPHALHDGGEVAAAEVRGGGETVLAVMHLVPGPGRAQQGLGRHTAHVQAVAPQEVAFDQRDSRAEPRGAGGADQSRRAAADHQQLVGLRRWSGLHPIRWMDVGEQPQVVLVARLDRKSEGLRHRPPRAERCAPIA
jgi:hypothetical protein